MLSPTLSSPGSGETETGTRGSSCGVLRHAAACCGVLRWPRTGGCPGTSPPAPSCARCCCCAEGDGRWHPARDAGSARRGHGGRPAPLAPTGTRLIPSPAASSELTSELWRCPPQPPRRRGFCAPQTPSASRSQWLTLQAAACRGVSLLRACPDFLRAPGCPTPCTGQAPFPPPRFPTARPGSPRPAQPLSPGAAPAAASCSPQFSWYLADGVLLLLLVLVLVLVLLLVLPLLARCSCHLCRPRTHRVGLGFFFAATGLARAWHAAHQGLPSACSPSPILSRLLQNLSGPRGRGGERGKRGSSRAPSSERAPHAAAAAARSQPLPRARPH